uniref:Elongator complex protein 4 n=1 Tax=Albugo laibachii Nc14 TaxID=890382 RepID=F0WVD6_9STRA|nr:elongator complex protein putative [Albugo laibachii Nc14]|eukprot:CCA25375.1 elongator complex protein putative [Albugo laibachii Nc14]
MSSFQRTFLPRVDHHKEETTLVPQNYDAYSVHPTKNGRYIISTGHPQLDRIIGGFELHTLTFWTHRVDQILASGHCVSLIQDMSRYFVAQGIVSNQSTIILTKDVTEGYHFIRNLIPATKSFSTASNQNATKNLNIAWQYEKYFETKTKMTERNEHKFCHSFDLSQIMSPQLVESNCPIIVSVPPTSKSDTLSQLIASDYFNQLFDLLKRQIQQIIDRYTEFRVIRINILQLIPKLHSNLHEIQTELYQIISSTGIKFVPRNFFNWKNFQFARICF